jgi:hypothetical protein
LRNCFRFDRVSFLHLPSAAAPFLRHLGLEFPLELVPIPPLRPEEPAIQEEREILGSNRGIVHLVQVCRSDVSRFLSRRSYLVRRTQFILFPVPPNLDLDREIIRPVRDDDRWSPLGIGKHKLIIPDVDRGSFPDDLEEMLAFVGRFEVGVERSRLAPTSEGDEETLDDRLGRLRMEDSWLTVPQSFLHHGTGQPEVVAANVPPEPDKRIGIDASGLTAQRLNLRDDSELPFADDVHGAIVPNLSISGR